MQRLIVFLKLLFWAALIFAYVAAVVPSDEAPSFSVSDKVNHMIAFLTLTVLAGLAWPYARWWKVGLLLAGFGALIEFTQIIPALHRDAELLDWVADSAAILVGLRIISPIRTRWRNALLRA